MPRVRPSSFRWRTTASQSQDYLAPDIVAAILRVKDFIAEGVDVKIGDLWGASVLQRAAAAGHLDVVDTLLQVGADPNETPHHGGEISLLRDYFLSSLQVRTIMTVLPLDGC